MHNQPTGKGMACTDTNRKGHDMHRHEPERAWHAQTRTGKGMTCTDTNWKGHDMHRHELEGQWHAQTRTGRAMTCTDTNWKGMTCRHEREGHDIHTRTGMGMTCTINKPEGNDMHRHERAQTSFNPNSTLCMPISRLNIKDLKLTIPSAILSPVPCIRRRSINWYAPYISFTDNPGDPQLPFPPKLTLRTPMIFLFVCVFSFVFVLDIGRKRAAHQRVKNPEILERLNLKVHLFRRNLRRNLKVDIKMAAVKNWVKPRKRKAGHKSMIGDTPSQFFQSCRRTIPLSSHGQKAHMQGWPDLTHAQIVHDKRSEQLDCRLGKVEIEETPNFDEWSTKHLTRFYWAFEPNATLTWTSRHLHKYLWNKHAPR